MGTTAVSLRQNERSNGHLAEISVGTGAPVGLVATVPARTTKILIQVLDNSISLRDDGGVPSATTGLVIAAGDIYVLEADAATLLNLSAIGVSGTARVRIAYYGY